MNDLSVGMEGRGGIETEKPIVDGKSRMICGL